MTDNQQFDFAFSASRRQLYTFLKVLVLLNLVFLAGTWAHHTGFFQFRKPTANLLLAQFNFGKENVVASWYSSMLFLLTGIVALFCCWADWVRSADPKGRTLSLGWMVMAGIFILLSYDEMGSFHEMIGETSLLKSTGSGKRAGWYAFYALCGAVAVFMILFFVYRFRKNRMTLLLTIIGVLFFASNPIQEKFEIHSWRSSADPSTWKRPVVYLLMEEGSEIFASFCFLFSFLTYAMGASAADGHSGIRFQTRLGKRLPLLLAGILLLVICLKLLIHFNAWNFSHDDNGIPRNWPPSMLFFVAFLVTGWMYATATKSFRLPALLLAVAALICSIYFGANMYGYYGHAYDRNLFGLIPYAVIALVTAAVAFLVKHPGSLATKLCWLLWLAGMAVSVMLRQSTPLIMTTLAGYLAGCCLLAGTYTGFIAGSLSRPATR